MPAFDLDGLGFSDPLFEHRLLTVVTIQSLSLACQLQQTLKERPVVFVWHRDVVNNGSGSVGIQECGEILPA